VMAAPGMYLLSNMLIRQYRDKVMESVNKMKVVQALKASSFYKIYQSLAG
jgi:hypothetical protein